MLFIIYILFFISIFLLTYNLIPTEEIKTKRRYKIILFSLYRPLIPFINIYTSKIKNPIYRETIKQKLIWSGLEDEITFEDFISIKILLFLTAPILLLYFKLLLNLHLDISVWFLTFIVFGTLLFSYPDLIISSRTQMREREIVKNFSNFLDLLVLVVEAGLEFNTALKKILPRIPENALKKELERLISQLSLGKTRKEALKEFARRVNLEEAISFTTSIIQADELGASLGAILRSLSEEIRLKRFNRAEKLANEAPAKMTIPLVLFIFPATFIIILGPVFFMLVKSGLF